MTVAGKTFVTATRVISLRWRPDRRQAAWILSSTASKRCFSTKSDCSASRETVTALAPRYLVEKSIETAADALTRFLEQAKEPALVEPGGDPIPLLRDSYAVELTSGKLFLQAWNRERTLSRRITQLLEERAGMLEFAVERFGKKSGILTLFDAARPKAVKVTRKASRQTYGEQFRRSLLRQFPGWRIVEISTEPDLQHSLSPTYPRALLRKGASGQAAIGCPADAQDVDAVLTFGLIWLDYVRRREKRLGINGLAVFVPEGRQRTTCLRLLHLDPQMAEWSAFVFTDRIEDRVDILDYGNIDTVLPVRSVSHLPEYVWWAERLSAYPFVGIREEHGGRTSWAVHGLEFAVWRPGEGLLFGIETKRRASESNLPEIEGLARELARLRSPDAADRSSPLYLKKPELWLEAQAQSGVRDIDASLEATPVYRQAPAFAGGERGILDLLAVDFAGRLAVLEVKVSEDLHLPLQALDYWIRVCWHAQRGDFNRSGYFPQKRLQAAPPRLILVAPALHFHPTTQTVTGFFSPQIEITTVGVASDWRERLRVMFRRQREARP
jgi:hypothetical protein